MNIRRSARAVLMGCFALLLALPALAPAMTFINPPLTVKSAITSGYPDVSIFAERYGANRGRLHMVYVDSNAQGGRSIYYTRETDIGNNVFLTPVRISPLNNSNYVDPDISVDRLGVAHICYAGPNLDTPSIANDDAIYYARVGTSGAIALSAIRVSPDTTTVASSPQIAAVKFRNTSLVQSFIAYVGNDPVGLDTDVYLLSSDSNSQNTFSTVGNVSNDTDSGENRIAFDLVESLPPTPGSSDYLIQGAVVWEKNTQLYVSTTFNASSTDVSFRAQQSLLGNVQADDPSLSIQSVNGAGNGYVGHLALRARDQAVPYLKYVQFAELPDAGTILKEERSSFSPVTQMTYPSITIEPYDSTDLSGSNFLTARFNKPVSISFYDAFTRTLNVARNTGGLGSSFDIQEGTPRPISSFTDTGFVSFNPSNFASEGPKVIATTRVNLVHRLRVAGQLNTDLVLVLETGYTTPTPSPTVSPSPTATGTVSPSATATPSPTAGPTATATATPTASISPTASATPSPTTIIVPTPSQTASPSPTPSPTSVGTPIPTPSPTPSPTLGPTLTPTPDVVNRTEILDTLLGYRPAPTSGRVAMGDSDGNGFWDIADVIAFNIP